MSLCKTCNDSCFLISPHISLTTTLLTPTAFLSSGILSVSQYEPIPANLINNSVLFLVEWLSSGQGLECLENDCSPVSASETCYHWSPPRPPRRLPSYLSKSWAADGDSLGVNLFSSSGNFLILDYST